MCYLGAGVQGTLLAGQRVFVIAPRISHAAILFTRGDGQGTHSASMHMQMQPQSPGGVAEDLVRNSLGFRGTASDGDACSG